MNAKAAVLVAFLFFLPPAHAAGNHVNCDIGPVRRVFGGSPWNLYACDDSKSMVAVPVDASNGSAGYFFITPGADNDELVVVGEGFGDDDTFRPVFDELKKMSKSELWLAISIARTIGARPNP